MKTKTIAEIWFVFLATATLAFWLYIAIKLIQVMGTDVVPPTIGVLIALAILVISCWAENQIKKP